MNPSIAIIDYGGQYVQNIRRTFREMSISAEILPPDVDYDRLESVDGVVLSGGPYSVYSNSAPSVNPKLLDGGRPVLGLCYGHQLISHVLGGVVSGGKAGEYGFSELTINRDNPLFSGVEGPQIVRSPAQSIVEHQRGHRQGLVVSPHRGGFQNFAEETARRSPTGILDQGVLRHVLDVVLQDRPDRKSRPMSCHYDQGNKRDQGGQPDAGHKGHALRSAAGVGLRFAAHAAHVAFPTAGTLSFSVSPGHANMLRGERRWLKAGAAAARLGPLRPTPDCWRFSSAELYRWHGVHTRPAHRCRW